MTRLNDDKIFVFYPSCPYTTLTMLQLSGHHTCITWAGFNTSRGQAPTGANTCSTKPRIRSSLVGWARTANVMRLIAMEQESDSMEVSSQQNTAKSISQCQEKNLLVEKHINIMISYALAKNCTSLEYVAIFEWTVQMFSQPDYVQYCSYNYHLPAGAKWAALSRQTLTPQMKHAT